MSQKGIDQLIGKALADQGFLEAFLKDPEGKAKAENLDISPDELSQIKKMNAVKVRHFAEVFTKEFGDRKQGMPIV